MKPDYTLMTVAQQEAHRERIEAMLGRARLTIDDLRALRFALACIQAVMDRAEQEKSHMADPPIPPPAIETLIKQLRVLFATLERKCAKCCFGDEPWLPHSLDPLIDAANALEAVATREQALREECDKWKADFHAAHTMYDDTQQRVSILRTALERLEHIYCLDGIAHQTAREIENIFDETLRKAR